MRLGEQADDLILDVVGILIFVYQNISEAMLVIRENIRVVAQHMQGVH